MTASANHASRRLQRPLNVTVVGPLGLTDGRAVWFDGDSLELLLRERLSPSRSHRVRVDLGALGQTVDLEQVLSGASLGDLPCLLASFPTRRALTRAMTLGPSGFRLVVRRARGLRSDMALRLVLQLPDGTYHQSSAVVLRLGRDRVMLAAERVSPEDLAVLRDHR